MPVGAGSIKRAAKTAATKPEIEKTESIKPETQKVEAKPSAKSTQKKAATAAAKTKEKTTKYTKQSKVGSTVSRQASDPKSLGNQIYHITDELPVHLL